MRAERVIEKCKKIFSDKCFLALLLSCFVLGLIGLYFATGTYRLELFFFYIIHPVIVLLNVLPYIAVGILGWMIFGRVWAGFLSSALVCILYSFPNYWKLVSRDDPFFAEDITLIKEAAQMSDEYLSITWEMYLAVLLIIIGTILLAKFIKDELKLNKKRIKGIVVWFLVCAVLYKGVYTSAWLYDAQKVWDKLNPWFENSNYISRGGIYPFIYSINDAIPKVPEGYNGKEAQQILADWEEDAISEEKQVNLMFVMYEAFSDLSTYTDYIDGIDPYESFHKLQSESYSGELVTNIFAGGTIDTERSVLTGFSELYSFRKPSWSYARYFADQGYTVEGSHAGYKSFYNRQNINSNLGIGGYRFIENYFSQFIDGIPMDDVFLPEITRLFEEQINNRNKVFSYNVTYQNHGPYATERDPEDIVYVSKQDLDEEDFAIVNNYLEGIENTGNHMYQIAEIFRDHEEPIVLVFFGDHKPWLGELSSTYTALGIDIFEENEESFYNHYNTEYLIWANDRAKEVLGNEFIGTGPDISPCFLMNVLFTQCGWDGPSMMKITNNVMKELPVITKNDRILQEGELIHPDDLTDNNKKLLDVYNMVQYYLANDSYKNMK